MSRLLTLLLACAALAACERPQLSRGGGLPTLKLNDAVGGQIGGPDTCLMVLDAATGASRYQYGLPSVCNRPLPPCATFEAPNALIALDAGLITPQAVLKWDGSPQPLSAWQKDADLATAFGQSIAWWDQALAARIGAPLYAQRLKALDYGSARPEGPLAHFWMGPAQGGGLVISTAAQARFLHRLYAGQLPVKAESASVVTGLMPSESRGDVTFSGKAASCDTAPDGSRSVGWSIGRLKAPDRDLVFAASIEGQNVFPGFEVENRLKAAFAAAGLWPAQ